jgi:hypothetical protein
MSQPVERIRFAVLLAVGLCLAAPPNAFAIDPVGSVTEAAAGATSTAQPAAGTATGGPATSDPQEATEVPPNAASLPAAPDPSAPAPAKPAASEPASAKEAAKPLSQTPNSTAGTGTSAIGAATQDVRDTASAAADSAARTGDSLTRKASESASAADVGRKLDSTAGAVGQTSETVRDGAQQISAGTGPNDLPPTGGLTGGDLLPPGTDDSTIPPGVGGLFSTLPEPGDNVPLPLGGSTPAPPGDGGRILPMLLGGPTSGLPSGGGTALLESGSGFPPVGPPGSGGIFPGGEAFTGGAAGGGSFPALFLLPKSFLRFPGASLAAVLTTQAGSGTPVPGIPGRGPAPFALPSLGGAFADGLLLAAGMLALLTIFFLTAPGLGRWIRTSAEKWPPPGLVSPIEVPG